MTCLGLDFAEYLDFLHRHRQVLIRPTGEVGYWIVCQPMAGKIHGIFPAGKHGAGGQSG